MNLTIKQSTSSPEILSSPNVVETLYQLTKPDPVTGLPTADAILQGRIQVPSAYEDAVNFLNTQFSAEQDNGSDFQVTVLNNNYYIRFADPAVVEVLRNSMGKDEGEGITVAEAAATNLGTIFRNNVDIESFDEFKYFISPSKTLSQQAFYNCSSLERLDLSNCTSYPNEAFYNLTNLEYTVWGGGVDSPQGVIIIPEGTTSIGGWNNFSKCNKITSVILPDSLAYIQGNNFQRMAALTEITVGTGMDRWVRGNFSDCPNFNKVNIKNLDAWLNITFESTGVAETPLAVARHLYLNGTEVTNVDFTGKTIVKDKVLWGCLGLASVVLPDTITSIGTSAFRNCDNLVIADLNLPNLATLGSYAFSGTKLQAISSLGNIASLSQGCFYNCTQLTNAVIPNNITTIPKECFCNCLSLTSVDLPSSVTTIGEDAFSDCRNLTTTDLTNITTFGARAFARCGNLSKFNGPNSTVGEIYLPNLTGNMQDAFRNLSQYASAQIIYNITSLGTITEIGEWGFSTMGIETIHLPSTLKVIGSNAFTNGSVHNIYWEGTMDQWVNIDFRGVGANPCSMHSVNFYVNGTTPTSYTFPDGTTEIKKYVFNGMKGLTSVTIPNSVTSIGEYAFGDCVDLASINIPTGVTSLNGTFFGCKSLLSLEIPNTVTYIGDYTFEGCHIQGTLSIPNTITSIGRKVFNGFKADTLIIPDSVTTIDGYVCMWHMNLNSLIIGSGVTSILYGFRDSTIGSITIYAINPPSITDGSGLIGTTIGAIFVPQGSVEAYKEAPVWSSKASIIQAIPTT